MSSIGDCVLAVARATTPAREARFLSSTSRRSAFGRVFKLRNVLAATNVSRFALDTEWMQTWPREGTQTLARAIRRSGTPWRFGKVTRRIPRFGVRVHREGCCRPWRCTASKRKEWSLSSTPEWTKPNLGLIRPFRVEIEPRSWPAPDPAMLPPHRAMNCASSNRVFVPASSSGSPVIPQQWPCCARSVRGWIGIWDWC